MRIKITVHDHKVEDLGCVSVDKGRDFLFTVLFTLSNFQCVHFSGLVSLLSACHLLNLLLLNYVNEVLVLVDTYLNASRLRMNGHKSCSHLDSHLA